MRITVPSSPSPSPPPSPVPQRASRSTPRRTSTGKNVLRRSSGGDDENDEDFEDSQYHSPSSSKLRKSAFQVSSPPRGSTSSFIGSRSVASPPRVTWENEEFYAAVRLRQRKDPVDDYEDRGRKAAFHEAHERTAKTWKPVAELLNLDDLTNAPSTSSPRRANSPPFSASQRFSPSKSTGPSAITTTLEKVREAQINEIQEILQSMKRVQIYDDNQRMSDQKKFKAELWGGIDKTIQEEEAMQRKIAEQKALELRRQQEEIARQRALEAQRLAEEKRRKEVEEEAKRKREEEERRKAEEERRMREEQEKNRLEEERIERQRREESERLKGIAPKSALEEYEEYAQMLKKLKNEIMPLVRGKKEDESMINRQWKTEWSRLRRSFTPKIGQITNSKNEIERIAGVIHDSLHPTPPYPEQLYLALLSSLSKIILLQAETEVTAKASTAYPLARVVVRLVEKGNPLLSDVFMARLVGRSGGWSVGCVVRRYQGQSDDEYRKSLGYKPVNSGETSGQYADRMVGMLTLYAAILQTSPTPSISQGFAPPPYIIPAPYAFQLPRLWTLLSRILSTPRLLEDPSAPQILFGVIEIAGDRALSVYGKQFAKIRRMLMRRCLMSEAELNAAGGPIVGGAAGKDGVASRMRLGLALEKWDKGEAPKIGPDGREMNP